MINNSLKIISFSSPKGGVGRTLTLANFGRIYADGEKWANIDPTITLLVDFDFSAPGINFYNYNIEENPSHFIYKKKEYSYEEIQSLLIENKIGLLFLFSDIIKNYKFQAVCRKAIKKYKKDQNYDFTEFREFLKEELFTNGSDPIDHLIQISGKSLYIFPAGSINNKDYENTLFNFEWLDFINNYLGLYLLDSIFGWFINYTIKENKKESIRIILDQQAGISAPAAINRAFADTIIYVSGFNKQNQSGLNGLLIKESNLEKSPWVILNQYDIRNKCFDINTSVINERNSPHKLFKEEDKIRRKDFIDKIEGIKINDTQIFKNRIFVTDFSNEAIQKEYFYPKDSISYRKLVEAIVSIETEFGYINKKEIEKNTIRTIKFVGEKVQLEDSKEKFYGPFIAILKSLLSFFPNAYIEGYAFTHEQIAELAINEKISLKLSEIKNKEEKIKIFVESNDDNINVQEIKIDEMDFISYPFYLKEEKYIKKNIQLFNEIQKFKISSEDTLGYLTNVYLQNNIIGWNDYAKTNEGIIGVPLFVSIQLIAFLNQEKNRENNFQEVFHKKSLRHFRGFNDPADILDYSELSSKQNETDKILLCTNKEIANFYEWQTISGIFNTETINYDINSIEYLIKYYFSEGIKFAIGKYLDLLVLSDNTEEKKSSNSNYINQTDWDVLLNEFFDKGDNRVIFLWPDTIPDTKRKDEKFVYNIPPAFHYFEECWMISAVKKQDDSYVKENQSFLLFLMTKHAQQDLLENGGLPVHKAIISEIENWYKYPFLPQLWKYYNDLRNKKDSKEKKKVFVRTSFPGYYKAAKELTELLLKKLDIKKIKDEKELNIKNIVLEFRKGMIDAICKTKIEDDINYLQTVVKDNTELNEYLKNKCKENKNE